MTLLHFLNPCAQGPNITILQINFSQFYTRHNLIRTGRAFDVLKWEETRLFCGFEEDIKSLQVQRLYSK